MLKANHIIIVGGFIVLIGLVNPWITFSVADQRAGNIWEFTMSPFTLNFNVFEISDPFHEIKSSGSQYFYKADATFIGITTILGILLSFIGGGLNKKRFIPLSGLITVLSIMAFWTTLPGYFSGLTVERGLYISLLGSFVIIFSTGLEHLIDNIRLSKI